MGGYLDPPQYKSWVHCRNCGSNHFQWIREGVTLHDAPCSKCGITHVLRVSTKNPADHGYTKSAVGGWY